MLDGTNNDRSWFPHFWTDKFPRLFQYFISIFQYFFSILFKVSPWDLITHSQECFTSITELFLKTLIGVKSYYHFCFCIFLFQNLKNVVQIPIDDYVIYSLTWPKMVKLLQMLQGNAEYLCLLIKSSDPQSYDQWSQKGYFYFSVLWNPQYLYTKEWFHSFEISCK